MAQTFDQTDFEEAARSAGEAIAKALDSFCATVGIVREIRVDYENDVCECDVEVYAHNALITCQLVSGGGWQQSIIPVPLIGSEVEVEFLNGSASKPFVTKVKAPDYVMVDLGQVQARISNEGSIIAVVEDAEGNEKSRVEIDTVGIRYKTVGQVMNMGMDNTIFNNGTQDGMVLINQLTGRLNNLVSQINEIQSAISSHTHLYNEDGVLYPTEPATYSRVDVSSFNKSDYENTVIKQ